MLVIYFNEKLKEKNQFAKPFSARQKIFGYLFSYFLFANYF